MAGYGIHMDVKTDNGRDLSPTSLDQFSFSDERDLDFGHLG